MNNLVDIRNQIEKLQKQAADIKAREFQNTVRDIVAKMEAFGITEADLRKARKAGARPSKGAGKGATKPAGKAPRRAAAKGGALPAKYRGPNGETWSGRGLPPRWLAALIAQGQPKEAFLIAS